MENEKTTFFISGGEHKIKIQFLKDIEKSSLEYVMPLNYGYQIPIIFHVEGDYSSYEIINEDDKPNKKIKFIFTNANKDDVAKISLKYLVIIKKSKYDLIPEKIPFPNEEEISEDNKKWLTSSTSIQSNNAFIKLTSLILKGFNTNLIWFIKKIMFWNAYHGTTVTFLKMNLPRKPLLRLLFVSDSFFLKFEDAVSCLFFGGTCIGKANLSTALLRARKIPSRVLLVTSLLYGKKYWLDSQHFITEYFLPKIGWVAGQAGEPVTHPRNNILLRIVTHEDENISGHGSGFYGGVHTWFWMKEKDYKFLIPDDFNHYRIPKTSKIGFPMVKAWQEKKLAIPKTFADDIEKLSREIWELYTKKVGKVPNNKKIIFENVCENQKKAVELLLDARYKESIEKMIESKNGFEQI